MLALAPDEALYFLHIPKTAGMTLSNMLDDTFNEDEILPTHYLPELILNPDLLHQVNKYRLYRGHFNQSLFSLVRKPLTVITVLRDPIDRTISNVEYAIELLRDGEEVPWPMDAGMTLEKFLESDHLHEYQTNVQFACLAGDLRWFDDELYGMNIRATEQIVEAKIRVTQDRLRSYKVVGIQERFHDTLLLMSYALGFPPPKQYANENVSTRKTKKADLSSELLAKARSFNELDYRLYNTAVEIFEQRFQAMCDHLNGLYPAQTGNLHAQLEAYYQQRLAQSSGQQWTVSSQDAPLHYTFDQKLIGSGWLLREKVGTAEEQHFMRWTGPGDEAALSLALPTKHPLQVKLRVIDSVNTAALDQLRMAVNGVEFPLACEFDDEADAHLYRGVIPYNALAAEGKPQQITLCAPASALSEKYPGSKRIGGVCLDSIEFLPLLPVEANTPLVIQFDDEMYGQNWYPVEHFKEWSSRWTGPGQSATLAIRLDPQTHYQLTLETLGFANAQGQKSFHLRLNDTDIPLQTRASKRAPQIIEFIAILPPQAMHPDPNFQLFQFIVDAPRPITGADGRIERTLGIRLMSMTLEPGKTSLSVPGRGFLKSVLRPRE